MDYNNQLISELTVKLAESAARNSVGFVSEKIRKSKAKKNDKETISELEEIILELQSDKAEILRIAQTYEQEFVSQKITEKDIEYIINNLLPIFSELVPNKVELEQIKSVLSVETFTILQLIGFNYKRAIGEPLTLLLKKVIESKMPVDSNLNAKYLLQFAELAKDEEATKRYYQLTGIEDPNKLNST